MEIKSKAVHLLRILADLDAVYPKELAHSQVSGATAWDSLTFRQVQGYLRDKGWIQKQRKTRSVVIVAPLP